MPKEYTSISYFKLGFFICTFLISIKLSASEFDRNSRKLINSVDNIGAETIDYFCIKFIDDYELNVKYKSPAIDFTPNSLFVGFSRNTAWFRADINEAGTIYVALYSSDITGISAAQVLNDATNTGALSSNRVNGGSFTFSGFTGDPDNPSFTSTTYGPTPYGGHQFTGLTLGATYHWAIVGYDLGNVNSTTVITGKNETKSQNCTITAPGSNQTGSSNSICGPRDVQFNVEFTGIGYSDPKMMLLSFYFDYEASRFTSTFKNSDFTLTTPNELDITKQKWKAYSTNTYPDNGTDCSYTARAVLRYSDDIRAICGAVFQDQTFEVFDDINNQNLGTHAITPNKVEVCEGAEKLDIQFSDVSAFNCQPPYEDDKINDKSRWIQWVYGSNAADADFLSDVVVHDTVNGVDVTSFPYSSEVFYLGDGTLVNPNPVNKGYKIDVLNTNVYAPSGKKFVIHLRSWNICNPYDDTGGPEFPATYLSPTSGNFIEGDKSPIILKDSIILIRAPDQVTNNDAPVCFGTDRGTFNFNVVSLATSTAITWYDNDPRTGGRAISNPNGTNSEQFPAASHPTMNTSIPGEYSLWATQSLSDTGLWGVQNIGDTSLCESIGQEVIMTVREELNKPMSVSFRNDPRDDQDINKFTVCESTTGWEFVASDTPITEPFGGNWIYDWDVATGLTVTSTSASTQAITVSHTASIRTQTTYYIRVRKSYNTSVNCYSGYRTITLTVDPKSEAGSIAVAGGITDICSGDSTGVMTLSNEVGVVLDWEFSINGVRFVSLGFAGATSLPAQRLTNTGINTITYRYRARVKSGVCPIADNNIFTFTVHPVPGKPTITEQAGNPFTICKDGSNVILESDNPGAIPGVRYFWFIDGTPGVDVGVGTNTLTLNSDIATGNYRVKIIEPRNNCESIPSDIRAVAINALPTAAVSGGGSVCSGNPAPDIVWTLTGTAPFDFTITRPAGEGANLVVQGYVTNTYTYPGRLMAGGNYEMTSLTDGNTCVGTSTGGAATVTIGGISPTLSNFRVDDAVCENNGSPNMPSWYIETDVAGDYAINYTIDGVVQPMESFNGVGARGTIIFQVSYAQVGSTPNTYTIELTSVVNTVTGCIAVLPGNTVDIVINSEPNNPTNPVDAVACSSDPTGGTMAVDDPGAGFVVRWYTAYTDETTNTVAAGITSGSREEMFTPTSNVTQTYITVIESNVRPTNCHSDKLNVQHTQGLLPTASVAGTDIKTCEISTKLGATAVDNGGYGLWTISNVAYYENFDSPTDDQIGAIGPIPTRTNAGLTFPQSQKWTLDVSGTETDPNITEVPNLANSNDWAKVNGGVFEIRAVGGEVLWKSEVFNITAFNGIDLSLELSSAGVDATDFVRCYYKLDGGAATQFTTNGYIDGRSGDFNVIASESGLNGTTLQIIVLARNASSQEFIRIDNVIAVESGTTPPIVSDHYDKTADITNLQVGTTTFTWQANSLRGVCTPSTDNISVTRHALPDANDITRRFCEVSFSSNNYGVTVADLSDFNDGVTGITGSTNRTIKYFETAARLVEVVAPYTVANGNKIFTEVKRTDVTPICINESVITITVDSLPATAHINNATSTFCEDAAGTRNHAGVDLEANYNLAAAGGDLTDRNVTWYLVYDSSTKVFSNPVVIGTAVGNTKNFTISDNLRIFAKIENTITNCVDVTQVDFTVNPLPNPNPILVYGVNNGSSANFCISTTPIIFNVDDGINNSTYSWSSTTSAIDIHSDTSISYVNVTLDNEITLADSAFLEVIETTVDGCSGSVTKLQIIVENVPSTPVINGDRDVCANQTGVVYTVSPGNPTSTYVWTLPAGVSISGVTDGSSITANFGTTSGNIGVTETNGSGCISPAANSLAVTLHGRPTLDSGLGATVCSDDVTGIEFASINLPVATEYNITSVFVAPGLLEDSSNAAKNGTSHAGVVAGFIKGDRFRNLTATNLAVVYTVISTTEDPSTLFCNGDPLNITLTVRPEPVQSNRTARECSGVAIGGVVLPTTTDGNGGTITKYDIDAVVDGDLTGAATTGVVGTTDVNIISGDVFTNLKNTGKNVVYTVTPYFGACVGTDFDITVTIDPEPVGITQTAPSSLICSKEEFNYDIQASNIQSSNGVSSYFSYTVTSINNAGATTDTGGPVSGYNRNLVNSPIQDKFINTTGSIDTIVYLITPKSIGGNCVGNQFTVTVVVNPEPVGFDEPTQISVCSGTSAIYDIQADNISKIGGNGNGVLSEFTYTISGPLTLEPNRTTFSNNGINHIYTNTSNSTKTITYTITPRADGTKCLGRAFQVQFNIDPEPVQSNQTAKECSDVAIGVVLPTTDNDGGMITKYDIDAVVDRDLAGAATTGVVGTTDVNIISGDVFTNLKDTVKNVVYTVTPYFGVCVGADFDITVAIDPEPVGITQTAPSSPICSKDEFNYDIQSYSINNSNGVSSYFSYTVNSIDNIGVTTNTGGPVSDHNRDLSGQSVSSIQDGFINTTGSIATIEYLITPESIGGNCVGNQFTVTVVVNPEPVGFDEPTQISVCSGTPAIYDIQADNISKIGGNGNGVLSEFTYTVSGALTLEPNRTTFSNNGINHIYTNTSNSTKTITYTITPRADGTKCLGAAFQVQFNIEPEPVQSDQTAKKCSDVAIGVVLPTTDNDGGMITKYDIDAVVDRDLTGAATTGVVGTTDVRIISSDVFTNLKNTDKNVVYTVTPYFGACVGADFDITVTIEPEPVQSNRTARECSGVAIGVVLPTTTDGNGVSITKYDIAAVVDGDLIGAATTGVVGTTDVNIISGDVFTNLKNTGKNVVYTVTPYFGACVGTDFDITVTIEPEPVQSNQTAKECSDVAIGVVLPTTDNDGGMITKYDIDAVVDRDLTGAATTGVVGTTDVNIISGDVFTNLKNTDKNVVYTVTPYFGACAGTGFDITVTIDPEPVQSNQTAKECSDVVIGVVLPTTDNDGGMITKYDIDAVVDRDLAGAATTGVVGTTDVNIISGDVFTNLKDTVKNVVYTVTPYFGVCVGADFDITVAIDPEPVGITQTAPSSPICSKDEFNYDIQSYSINNSNGVSSYFSYTVNSIDNIGVTTNTGGPVSDHNRDLSGQSVSSIQDGFINTTGSIATIEYLITPESIGGNCVGNQFTVTVVVNPEPVGFDEPTQISVCSGTPAIYDIQADNISKIGGNGNGVLSEFTYTVSGALTLEPNRTTFSNNGINHIYTNTSNSTKTITYTITPRADGTKCLGAAFQVQFNIEPEPVQSDQTAKKCSDVAIGVVLPTTDNDGGMITKYDIDAVVDRDLTGAATTGVVGTTDVRIISSDVFTNLKNTDKNVVYTVTPYFGACVGADFDITVTIEPEPVQSNRTARECSGVAIGVVLPTTTDGNGVSITKYDIAAVVDGDLIGAATTGVVGTTDVNIISGDVFTNLKNTGKNVVYTVTPYFGACVGTDFDITVTIEPEPVQSNQTAKECSDVAIGVVLPTTDNDGGMITKYDIDAVVDRDLTGAATTGVVGTTDVNIISGDVFTNLKNTDKNVVYTVTPYFGACAGTGFDITVTIDPEPVQSDQTAKECSDVAIGVVLPTTDNDGGMITKYDIDAVVDRDLTGAATTGVVGTADVNIISGDVFTNLKNTDKNVVYTVTPYFGACVGADFNITVAINPEPVGITQTASSSPICSKDEFNYDIQLHSIDNSNGVSSYFSYTVTSIDNTGVTTDTGGPVSDYNRNLASQSVSSIQDGFINTTGSIATIEYLITPESIVESCVGDQFTITAVVNPEPVGFDEPTQISVCSGTPAIYDIQADNISKIGGNGVLSDFTYTVSGALTLEPNRTTFSNNGINHIYTNTSNSTKTITYTITPRADGTNCLGAAFQVQFDIDPEPVGTDVTTDICGGVTSIVNYDIQDAVNLRNGINSVFTYVVSSSDETVTPTPSALDRKSATDRVINDTYNNTSSNPVTITYRVTPYTNTTNCEGVPFELRFVIIPGSRGFNDTQDVCSGDAISYNLFNDNINNGGNGVLGKYKYTVTSTGSLVDLSPDLTTLDRPVASTDPINDTYVNTGNNAITVIYTITPINTRGLGCNGADFTVSFDVYPAPVGTDDLDEVVCSGKATSYDLQGNIDLSNRLPSEFTYTVTSSDPVNVPALGDRVAFSAAPIDIQAINTTVNAVFITYTVTPRRTGLAAPKNNCTGNTFQVRYQIDPEPIGTVQTLSVCSDEPVTTIIGTYAASVPAFTYTILVGNPDGLTQSAGLFSAGVSKQADEISDDAWTNTGSVTSTVTYTITPISVDGCVGNDYTIVVDVLPEPTMTPTSADLCTNIPSGIVFNPTGAAIKKYILVDVRIPTIANFTIGQVTTSGLSYSNADFLAMDRFINGTTNDVIVEYDVIPVSNDDCQGDLMTVPFTVQPAPDLTNDLDNIVCSDAVANITLSLASAVPAINGYTIHMSSLPGALIAERTNNITTTPTGSLGIGDIADEIFNNPTNTPLTVVYTIVPNGDCDGAPETISLTIEPEVRMINPGDSEICTGDETGILLNSNTQPTVGDVQYTYFASSTSGLVSGFSLAPSNVGEGYIIRDNLENDDDVVQTVEYTITYAATLAADGFAGGCTGIATETVIVSVDPRPKMDKIFPTPICSGDSIDYPLTSPTTLPNGQVVTFELISATYPAGVTGSYKGGEIVPEFDDDITNGRLLDVVTNTTDDSQIVTYTLMPRNSRGNATCVGEKVVLSLTVNPTPLLTFKPIDAQCANSVYVGTLELGVAGQPPLDYDYEIRSNDGSNALIYTGSGVMGAGGVVVVNGTESQLNITSDFRIDIIAASDFNKCAVAVLPSLAVPVVQVDASFTPDRLEVCNTSPVDGTAAIFNFTIDNYVAAYIYTWNWGDGSAAEVATGVTTAHTYENPSLSDFSFTPFLTVEHNTIPSCLKFNTETVIVYPDVIPIVYSFKENICSGADVNMFNATIGVDVHDWTYEIVGFGMFNDQDQSTETAMFNFVNNDPAYSNPQEFIIHYSGTKNNAVENCNAAETYSVMVYKDPVATFTSMNGTPIAGGFETGLNSGIATFMLKNLSTPNNNPDFSYDWDYGNGQTSTDYDPDDTKSSYTIERDYTSMLTVTNNVASNDGLQCRDFTSLTLRVTDAPIIADFEIIAVDEGCIPSKVTIRNLTEGGANKFEWRVFQGGIEVFSTTQTIVNLNQVQNSGIEVFDFEIYQAGEYSVEMIASNVQNPTKEKRIIKANVINIYEAPQALFTMSPNQIVYIPDTRLNITNETLTSDRDIHGRSRSVIWHWDFGDGLGFTQDLEEPTPYIYTTESLNEPDSVFSVTLSAAYDYGGVVCADTIQNIIRAEGGGSISTPNAFTPNPNGSTGGSVDPGSLYGTGNDLNDVFIPEVDGVAEFNMQIYDRWGTMIFESNDKYTGWDGYYKGKLMPQGVYVYKLTLRLVNGERDIRIGDITLLR